MQAVLIPFLLAANVSLNNDVVWKNGALSKWKAGIDLLGANNVRKLFSMNGTFDIECTTKDTVNVLCRALHFDTYFGDIHSVKKYNFSKNVLFGITFNERGVEKIAVPNDMQPQQVTFLKKFLALFNIGTDLNEKKNQLTAFETSVKSLLGDCKTKYSLSKEAIETSFRTEMSPSRKNYEVFIIPLPKGVTGRLMVINKETDAVECDKKGLYFHEYVENVDMPVDTKSHTTSIRIGEKGYFEVKSVTEGHYSIKDKVAVNKFDVTETLFVKLESVQEAKVPLPEIENPMITTLVLDGIDGKDSTANS